MEKIIATVVGIIIVLGLISYAILGQVEKVKDAGDAAQIAQDKINLTLEDSSIVTGDTVKSYNEQASSTGITVTIYESDGTTALAIAKVKSGALFSMEKGYNENAELTKVTFTQVDLSR